MQPVTHRPPEDTARGVEIPAALKRHLGLDHDRPWIIVSEDDQFVWPGYDLRKVRGRNRDDYGYLPPLFLKQVLGAFHAWHRAHKVTVTRR